MMLFVVTLLAFLLAIGAMALGVLLGGRPIAGSCGRDCSCHGAGDD